jgi:hypothetical protein
MSRAAVITLLLGLLATSAAVSSARAAQPRLTRCTALTLTEGGSGRGVFTGACNGTDTTLNITPGAVVGRVGGLSTKLHGDGTTFAGRIGRSNVAFSIGGGRIAGRYGTHALSFAMLGTAVSGRVGRAHVSCSLSLLSPLGEQISCRGLRGDAEVLVPVLAILYAAP